MVDFHGFSRQLAVSLHTSLVGRFLLRSVTVWAPPILDANHVGFLPHRLILHGPCTRTTSCLPCRKTKQNFKVQKNDPQKNTGDRKIVSLTTMTHWSFSSPPKEIEDWLPGCRAIIISSSGSSCCAEVMFSGTSTWNQEILMANPCWSPHHPNVQTLPWNLFKVPYSKLIQRSIQGSIKKRPNHSC